MHVDAVEKKAVHSEPDVWSSVHDFHVVYKLCLNHPVNIYAMLKRRIIWAQERTTSPRRLITLPGSDQVQRPGYVVCRKRQVSKRVSKSVPMEGEFQKEKKGQGARDINMTFQT